MPIRGLFLDIGNVLLTNGWDHAERNAAAEQFHLDLDEMEDRHHLVFEAYENGKLTLAQYLDQVVFYQERSFTFEQFRDFMFSQSKPFPDMISLVRRLKNRHGLKVAAVSNEGRELTEYRVRRFELDAVFDCFISSCFVGLRKPDPEIFRLAADVMQVLPHAAAYVDDRALFVQMAESFGFHGIHHIGYDATRAKLATLGLQDLS